MKTIRSKALEIYSDCGRDEVPVFFIHCWRGGMRSDAVAWLLSLYGYKVFVLTGGYKSYRRWALQQFELKRDFRVLGGYTGSGKTELLGSLKALGECVVDLEQLAHHKGSSFGSLGMPPQPAQEMFENQLAWELGMYCSEEKPVWIEDESPNVGGIHIPVLLWRQMRTAQICFIDIPFDQRLKHITAYYGTFGKNLIADGVLRIKKKLGGLETRNALQYLENDDQERCFEILLKYYDKVYEKALKNHLNEGASLHKIICKSVDTNNARIILESYPE